jgi:hypothetical protein
VCDGVGDEDAPDLVDTINWYIMSSNKVEDIAIIIYIRPITVI